MLLLRKRFKWWGVRDEALLPSKEDRKGSFKGIVGTGTFEVDSAEQQGEREAVGVEHTAGYTLVNHLVNNSTFYDAY